VILNPCQESLGGLSYFLNCEAFQAADQDVSIPLILLNCLENLARYAHSVKVLCTVLSFHIPDQYQPHSLSG